MADEGGEAVGGDKTPLPEVPRPDPQPNMDAQYAMRLAEHW